MKKTILALIACLSSVSFAVPNTDHVFITIGSDALQRSSRSISNFEIVKEGAKASLVRIPTSQIEKLSELMHDHFKRCGGYMGHNNYEQALEEFNKAHQATAITRNIFVDYSIDQQDIVNELVSEVDAFQIETTIRHLSSYRNRFYKSEHGVNSAKWIAQTWANMLAHRSDVYVSEFKHDRWAQPSVIAMIQGQTDEVIVIGGHLDSIAGWFGGNNVDAPGADDNASGISTITEVIRIIGQSGYQPQKTIMFMGYAAEEVGLWGSKEIAKIYRQNKENVVGVLQLDMTNYNGSDEEIHLISDYTNSTQNQFVGALIDEYFQYTWTFDRCGYACSDHASWHQEGFVVSFPFEANSDDMNPHIHTRRDVIDQSGGHAEHAAKFAKIAIAYLVEMDR